MPNDICTAPMQPFTVIARHSNQHIVRTIIIIIIIIIITMLSCSYSLMRDGQFCLPFMLPIIEMSRCTLVVIAG